MHGPSTFLTLSVRRLVAAELRLLAGLALVVGVAAPLGAASSGNTSMMQRRVEQTIETLQARLGIDGEITAVLVDSHPLVVAVERDPGLRGVYRLSLEASFLDGLTDDELNAVIAHELGHVWIYTHHPFLQTEQLANQIAMRVVDRQTIEAVYNKVWTRVGKEGSVPRFSH